MATLKLNAKLTPQARKDVRDYARALRRKTRADYRFTVSADQAIFRNLQTTGRSTQAALSAQQARIQGKLTDFVNSRSAATGASVSGAQAESVNSYGSALSGAVGQLYGGAQAEAQNARTLAQHEKAASNTLTRGALTSMKVERAGVREAKAGAQYATAVALSARKGQDAALIAQQRLELQKMQMQSELDYQNWKRKMDYTTQQEQKNPAQLSGITQLASSAPEMSYQLRMYAQEHPDKNVSDVISAVAAAQGYTANDPQYTVLRQIALSLQNSHVLYGAVGHTYNTEVDAVWSALHLLYGDKAATWKKFLAGKGDPIEAGIRSAYSSGAARAASDATNPDATYRGGAQNLQSDQVTKAVVAEQGAQDAAASKQHLTHYGSGYAGYYLDSSGYVWDWSPTAGKFVKRSPALKLR